MRKTKTETYLEYEECRVYFQKGSGYELQPHQHEEHQVIFSFQGPFTCLTPKQTIEVPAGKAIFIKSQVPHSFSSKGNNDERLMLNFTEAFWNKTLQRFGEDMKLERETFRFSTSSLSRQLINTIVSCHNPQIQKTLVDAFFSLMILEIRHQLNHQMLKLETDNPQLRAVVSHIDLNFEQDLNREQLAKAHGMSSRNLSRLFKAEFGLTPKQYHIQRRMQAARELIASNQLTLSEIALQLGFSSLSHFLDTYKKYTGRALS